MTSATLASWSPATDWASAAQSARNSATASTAPRFGALRPTIIPPTSRAPSAASTAACLGAPVLCPFGYHNIAQSTGTDGGVMGPVFGIGGSQMPDLAECMKSVWVYERTGPSGLHHP